MCDVVEKVNLVLDCAKNRKHTVKTIVLMETPSPDLVSRGRQAGIHILSLQEMEVSRQLLSPPFVFVYSSFTSFFMFVFFFCSTDFFILKCCAFLFTLEFLYSSCRFFSQLNSCIVIVFSLFNIWVFVVQFWFVVNTSVMFYLFLASFPLVLASFQLSCSLVRSSFLQFLYFLCPFIFHLYWLN